MPFPSTGILDSCTRANENPVVGWTDNVDGSAYGGMQIVSNRLVPVSGDAWNYYAASTYGPDCEVYWTDDGSANVTFYLRLSPIGGATVDGYGLARTSTTLSIIRLDNDADTVLGGAISQASSAGDSFGLEAVGSTLTAYYKPSGGSWASVGSRTDSTYIQSGRIAPYMTGAGASIYDIGGGNYSSGTFQYVRRAYY